MQLKQKRGQLSYGSSFKLFYFSWVLGWALLMLPIIAIMLLTVLVGGTFTMNGETQTGTAAIWSVLGFLIFFPLIIAIQGIFGAGLMTLGSWLYRRFRPITVGSQEDAF